MFRYILFFLGCASFLCAKPRFLHVSYHGSCLQEIEQVAKELDFFEVESFQVLSSPANQFDGKIPPKAIERYCVNKDLANRIWNQNKSYFSSFDGYIVSDTAPLSQIFLQNAPKKPLLIWICNRFDFWPSATKPSSFTKHFYKLLNKAQEPHSKTKIVPWSFYDAAYFQKKMHCRYDACITPMGVIREDFVHIFNKSVPLSVDKKETFYLGRYPNTNRLHIPEILNQKNIPFYQGFYNGPKDLEDFKGVIHIPFVTSSFTFFELLSLGQVIFVPSPKFFRALYEQSTGLFIMHTKAVLCRNLLEEFLYGCEAYLPEYRESVVYFDSWNDLLCKTLTTDYAAISEKTRLSAEKRKERLLKEWKRIFQSLVAKVD